jgi:hypothetical protein
MACKDCKKTAKKVANKLTGRDKLTSIEEGQLKDIKWLEESSQGKFMESVSRLTTTEKIVSYIVFWIPLFFGYYTIIRLLISLFI